MLVSLYRSAIIRMVLKRILGAIPILFGVTFIVFTLLNALPGGTVEQLLGANPSPQLVRALTIKLGLNHPFIPRYFQWLLRALHGNFGDSLENGVPVITTLAQRVPVTVELGSVAFIESLCFAVPVALLAARKPRGVVDRLNLIISMVGLSTPAFVVGLVGIWIFAVHLAWVPAIGFTPISQGLWSNLHSIILPSSVIAFGICCAYTRILRADLIDQMESADYVITARAKGVPSWLILLRHAFRNALFNLITVAILNLGMIFAGAVVIEEIFGIPGMGLLLLSSITNRDVPTVQALVTIIACGIVLANLVSDIIYTILDPRIRHGA